MPLVECSGEDRQRLQVALDEARQGIEEGGIAVGAALYSEEGKLLGRGRNRLQQEDNPLLHGETHCIYQAYKNQGGEIDFTKTVLYTSLTPCAMCAGTVVRFGIPRVVIGNDRSFPGEIGYLLLRNIEVAIANDEESISTFETWIADPENKRKFLRDTTGRLGRA